jgi:polyphosphate glucokinase
VGGVAATPTAATPTADTAAADTADVTHAGPRFPVRHGGLPGRSLGLTSPLSAPGSAHRGFGVDIGGSGIKGAVVDLDTGLLLVERHKLATPQPSTPDAVAQVVAQVTAHFGWDGPFGATFPAPVINGVARTAANVDPSWIDTDVEAVLGAATGCDVTAINDADAAGVAEAAFGAARDHDGLVIVTTLGTGIGTALLYQGVLIPNSELGHLEVDGHDAEVRASSGAREREELSWAEWAARLERYFEALERYLWPELFVVGGGVSRKADKFLDRIHLRTPIVVAELRNEAGMVGAARHADRQPSRLRKLDT